MREIDRDELKLIAESLIQQFHITKDDREGLREVADTADYITADWWNDSTDCGCLVGTMLVNREGCDPRSDAVIRCATRKSDAILRLATAFATRLARNYPELSFSATLKVVDSS